MERPERKQRSPLNAANAKNGVVTSESRLSSASGLALNCPKYALPDMRWRFQSTGPKAAASRRRAPRRETTPSSKMSWA
jgi:hypothetical protein